MANVAQLVEPRFVVPVVVGSSPIVRPRLKNRCLYSGTCFCIGKNYRKIFWQLCLFMLSEVMLLTVAARVHAAFAYAQIVAGTAALPRA